MHGGSLCIAGDWLAPDDGQASTKTSTTTIATSTSEGTVFHIYQIESENAGLEGTDIHFTRVCVCMHRERTLMIG